MARFGLRRGCAGALALSAASALWLGCAPASAADDGAAPIWESVGSIFSFAWGGDKDKDQKVIDYRDRPRLVLPPKMELPPPAAPPAASATDWPRDPDVEALKKEQAERKKLHPMVGDRSFLASKPKYVDPATLVTTNYTAGMGPGQRRCAVGPGQSCDSPSLPAINWNPLTWVGLQKKPATVLGPEPERSNLTDPPEGYRAPAEGVGAKVDN